jgi:hypothetical protein
MGLLGWLNRNGNEILSPTMVDPGFKRADRALEMGAAAGATVVGRRAGHRGGWTTRRRTAARPRSSRIGEPSPTPRNARRSA